MVLDPMVVKPHTINVCNMMPDAASLLAVRHFMGKKYKIQSWSPEERYPLQTLTLDGLCDHLVISSDKGLKPNITLNTGDHKRYFMKHYDPVFDEITWVIKDRTGKVKMVRTEKELDEDCQVRD